MRGAKSYFDQVSVPLPKNIISAPMTSTETKIVSYAKPFSLMWRIVVCYLLAL